MHLLGINIISHDFPVRVDRIDLGLLGIAAWVGHVNRHEGAIFLQDKAVFKALSDGIGERVNSYNRAVVVDSFSDRYIRVPHCVDWILEGLPSLCRRKPWRGGFWDL